MAKHADANLISRHGIHFKEFNNETEMINYIDLTPSDLYKVSLRLDTFMLYVLTSLNPITWYPLSLNISYQNQIDAKASAIHLHEAPSIIQDSTHRFVTDSDLALLSNIYNKTEIDLKFATIDCGNW